MEVRRFLCMALSFILLFSAFETLSATGGEEGMVGINYGLKGDNLPPPETVIGMLRSRSITKLRLFDPNAGALSALQNSGIDVVMGVLNEDLQPLASNPSYATAWVAAHVLPYHPAVSFRYISAGNEVIPGPLSPYVLPAMQNLETALASASVHVPVTTAVATKILDESYPPSKGSFSEPSSPFMAPIVSFLAARNEAPLLVNLYTYFSYVSDTDNIALPYALVAPGESGSVVLDGGLPYKNLFDATLDAVYSALERVEGGKNVRVAVSETGWPSGGGGTGATLENARMYNNNVVAHVGSGVGTPKRPGKAVETYLFAVFNEDLKPAGTEQNFGLYHPDMTEVYHVDFTRSS